MIIAANVLEAREHENAERLRVYKVGAPGIPDLQVIANKTNVYEVGDVVLLVTIGTTCPDGTEIKATRIRGVDSAGMLVGKTDAVPGTTGLPFPTAE